MTRPPVSELALARAWATGAIPSHLITTDGLAVDVVYRGSWTHGSGPDFSGAMVALPNGRLLTGSIEFHLITSGWRSHGHHRDPAYDDVILHLVGEDDGGETIRSSGEHVPLAIVGFEEAVAVNAALDWSKVGGSICAADLAQRQPQLLIDQIRQLGDRRLATKSAQYEAALSSTTPSQALWSGVLEALGYQANRQPMQVLANRLRFVSLERELSLVSDRFLTASSLLLGAAGFLPLTPRDAMTGGIAPEQAHRIEQAWVQLRRVVDEPMRPGDWQTHRVRPANHPVARLLVAAVILHLAGSGLTSLLLDPIRNGVSFPDALIAMTERMGVQIGADRAIAIAANVVIPFALALAAQNDDLALTEAASHAWEQLPASSPNRITKASTIQVTGGPALRGIGERGMQGLIHLNRALCTPRRCFECPVAALVLSAD